MLLGSLPALSESGQADGNCRLLRDVCVYVKCKVRNIKISLFLVTLPLRLLLWPCLYHITVTERGCFRSEAIPQPCIKPKRTNWLLGSSL